MDNLNTLRSDVRAFYSRHQNTFRRPSIRDCIYYAITEAGEAIDAFLRDERPDDVRRVERDSDFDAEVGDMKFMMLAATLDDPDDWWAYLPEYLQGKTNTHLDVLNALSQLSTGQVKSAILFMNWDLYPRCDAIYGTIRKLEKRISSVQKPEQKVAEEKQNAITTD